MQTNPAVEQNKNIKWSESPWNQSGRKGKGLWRKWFAEEPSLLWGLLERCDLPSWSGDRLSNGFWCILSLWPDKKIDVWWVVTAVLKRFTEDELQLQDQNFRVSDTSSPNLNFWGFRKPCDTYTISAPQSSLDKRTIKRTYRPGSRLYSCSKCSHEVSWSKIVPYFYHKHYR